LRARLSRLSRLGLRRAPAKVLEVMRRESNDALASIGRKLDPLGESQYDWEGAMALVLKYQPAGMDAPMELVAPTELLMSSGSRYLGWETVHRGSLAMFKVPGDHLSMLTEPQVDVLAQLVADRLRAAQTRQREPGG
jgi:thioesterase domain-containing protein